MVKSIEGSRETRKLVGERWRRRVDGIDIGNHLMFKLYVNSILLKVKQRAATILRCFHTRYANILTKTFTVYVHPLWEYCCSLWSPYLAWLTDNIEGIQRYFTKKLRSIGHVSYIHCVKTLKIKWYGFWRIKAATRSRYLKIHAKNLKIQLYLKAFVIVQ